MGRKSHDPNLTIAELTQRAARARELLAQVRALFPEARALPADDRRRSRGKLGGDEARALRGVVDAMDLEPALFATLADDDEGHEPDKVETDLLRDRFDRHALYASLAEATGEVAALFSDTALGMASLCKPVALAAYEIAKPVSKRHPALREKIGPALEYYGANAAASVAARRARRTDNQPA